MLVSTRSRFGLCSVLLLAGLAACGGSSTPVDGGGDDGGLGGGSGKGGHTGTGGGLGRGGMTGTGGGVAGAAGGSTATGGIGGGTAGSGVAGAGVTGTGGVNVGGAGGGLVVGTGGNTGGAGATTAMGGHAGMGTGGGMAGRGGVGGGMAGRGGAGGRGGPGVGGAGGAAACAEGTHRCGNACVTNNSPASGCTATGCQACRDTTSGDPVCRGNTCDINCQSQFHGCGTAANRTCVPDNNMSNTSCGNTCMACPTMTGGTSTCNGTQCIPRCNTGFHLCNGNCVANTSPNMCGPDDGDCSACRTGESCQAPGGCQTTSCPAANQHICGGTCVDQSATQCGAMCATCPTPAADKNSVANCSTTGVCRNVCKPGGYHMCGGTTDDPTCKSNNDVATCGSSCTACSPATLDHGVVGCSGTGCTFTCNQDYHECKADTAGTPICLLNASVDSCGNKCVRCPDSTKPGSNAAPICEQASGGAYECGITCTGTGKKCGAGSAAFCCLANQMCGTNGTCVAGTGGAAGGGS